MCDTCMLLAIHHIQPHNDLLVCYFCCYTGEKSFGWTRTFLWCFWWCWIDDFFPRFHVILISISTSLLKWEESVLIRVKYLSDGNLLNPQMIFHLFCIQTLTPLTSHSFMSDVVLSSTKKIESILLFPKRPCPSWGSFPTTPCNVLLTSVFPASVPGKPR